MDSQKQHTAVKIAIKDLINGEFAGEGNKALLKTKSGDEVSKVRVLGTVVEKFIAPDSKFGTLTIDDATETILLKFFKEDVLKFQKFEVGDVLDALGFVRLYEGEIYVSPEIIQKIDDPNWELLRKLELSNFEITEVDIANIRELVLKTIKELDSGSGASMAGVVEKLNSIESTIIIETVRDLLFKGDLFEPKRGVLKPIE